MVMLQLWRWKFSHKEKDSIRLKIAFLATLLRLRGNMHAPFIARRNARGQLPIRLRHN